MWLGVAGFVSCIAILVVMVVTKKKKWPFAAGAFLSLLVFALGIALVVSSYNQYKNDKNSAKKTEEKKTSQKAIDKKNGLKSLESGTYAIPEGWVKSDMQSTEQQTFYIKKGDQQKKPSSISVEEGENGYSVDQHPVFRQAILNILGMKSSESHGEITIEGSGSRSKNGDILYVFTIVETESRVTVKQYYIVGDYKYILIISRDLNDPNVTDIDQASQSIVDSFKWTDH